MRNLNSMIKILQNTKWGPDLLKLMRILPLTPAGPQIWILLPTLNCRGAKNFTVCLSFESSALLNISPLSQIVKFNEWPLKIIIQNFCLQNCPICSQNFLIVLFNLYFQCKMDNKLCISNLNNCADLIPYKAKFNFCDLSVVSGDLPELRRE